MPPIIKTFLKMLMLRIFPSIGPKGVINKQITIYKRLKKKSPTASENDLLNSLIMSRINAPPSASTYQDEYAHYETILHNSNKTLEDVICAIVEYEYILSREEILNRELFGDPHAAIAEFLEEWKRYIKERVAELTRTTQ